jgi:hypothetical protein
MEKQVTHHYAAKVIIGPIVEVPEEDKPNVVNLVRRVRIITVNGEIWAKLFWAFGLQDDEAGVKQVVADWDKNCNDGNWTKLSPEPSEK